MGAGCTSLGFRGLGGKGEWMSFRYSLGFDARGLVKPKP